MRFGPVLGWAGLIWLSSPTLPLLRARLAGGAGFRWLVAGLLAASGTFAVALAVRRLRRGECRLARVVGIALLTLGLVLAARLLAPPDPRSRLVELVHFVEFGALAALAFHALGRELGVANRVVAALVIVLAVGVADETLQHILASRFAEVRDVALNGAAGILGVGYAIVLSPPGQWRAEAPRRQWQPTLAMGAGLLLALGLFIDQVHRAHWIRWEGAEFRSSYSESRLLLNRAERQSLWSGISPEEGASRLLRPDARFLALNDPYATEARFHVQERNEAFDRGDLRAAAFENAVLERFYAPFLDAVGARRTDLPPRPTGRYRSPVLAHLWPELSASELWTSVALLEIVLGGAILWLRKAQNR